MHTLEAVCFWETCLDSSEKTGISKGSSPATSSDLGLTTRVRIWLGASYRTNKSLVVMFEINVNQWVRFGYAYDTHFNGIDKYASGSHEIMLGIDFGKTIVKTSSPRYF